MGETKVETLMLLPCRSIRTVSKGWKRSPWCGRDGFFRKSGGGENYGAKELSREQRSSKC